MASVTGSFTATGQSSVTGLHGKFSLSLTGFGVGTVKLERSFDDGTTWGVVEEFTADAEKVGEENSYGAVYRLNCTAYTSGTIAYVLTQ